MSIPNARQITPQLVKDHGLKPDEHERFVKLLDREPAITGLGICWVTWNGRWKPRIITRRLMCANP